MSCPCGSEQKYSECCGPIIDGSTSAKTAEALMRARYSAYVKAEIDFLIDSLHPDGSRGVDRDSTRAWAENADWLGLEILETAAGGESDETGEVEFVAKFFMQGEPQRHHERGAFKRHNGQWKYLDGAEIHPQPIVGPLVRLGRNDACVCGSEKKFKKCCQVTFSRGADSPEALVRARFAAPLVGEVRFLERSLHPEASQASSKAEEDPPRILSLGKIDTQGDTASASVTLFMAEGEEGRSQTYQLKSAQGRWLFLSGS